MNDFKIIFSGPVGAGKTTAIGTLSDIPPVTTDELTSDMTRAQKQDATLVMDYGMLKLGQGQRIHLYGTPGQERFDFMREILTQGDLGLILLLDNSRPNPLGDLQFYLDACKGFINGNKLVIGVTRMDIDRRPSLDDYHLQMESWGGKIPIFEVDARRKRDVSLLVEALLYSIDPGIDR